MPAWSYSALSSFETCPRRHFLTRVSKAVKEPESEALRWGNYVHKALEDRLRDSKPLPTTLSTHEAFCQKVESIEDAKLMVEYEAAITKEFQPTGWWDRDVWCRSKWDLGILKGNALGIYDWKTGKRKLDIDQMELFALSAFIHLPDVEVVTSGYVWLKDKKIDREKFRRDQAPEIWSRWLPRVERFNQAFEQDKWPAKPSGLCRKWCPVGKHNCEHCGE